jgi:probable HAF family extracellular repeat protein
MNTEELRSMPVNTYTTLDDPLATNGTFAWGINASGQIVGSYGDASIFYHGFLYSGGSSPPSTAPCPAARLHTASTIWVRS